MKRKAFTRQLARKRRRITKSLKRKRTSSYSTPSSRSVALPTPPPSGPGFGRRLFRGIGNVACVVSGALVGPGAGLGTAAAFEGTEMGYDYLTRTGPAASKGKGGFGSSYGGSTGKLKKFGYKKKKNPSVTALQKKGITVVYEARKTATTTNAEAIAVGHTSMPGKQCAINLWRALIKYILIKAGVLIKDFGALMGNGDFTVGDIFRINRYTSNTATSTSSDTFTITSTMTFDLLCAQIAQLYDDATTLFDERWESMEIVPFTGSKIPAVNVELNNLRVTVYTKSVLKLQNITSDTAADNESDDITRVPLAGKIFGCRGNNFVKKSNGSMLTGLFNTADEDCLFGAWTKQTASVLGGTSVGYYHADSGPANSSETTFFKPAEPPRQYEISNCNAMGNVLIGPGEIKKNTLIQKYTFGVSFYLDLLYSKQNTSNSLTVYNPKQGKTSVVYLEKMVGRSATAENNVKVWVELEFRQSVLIHGSTSNFTMPITYQGDF